ncbi:MAG: hypothetical protein LBD68_03080, partial [Zoogloeaceae bacterium]|nr:hypothetical protein [Zoogloeaceae bacterium]
SVQIKGARNSKTPYIRVENDGLGRRQDFPTPKTRPLYNVIPILETAAIHPQGHEVRANAVMRADGQRKRFHEFPQASVWLFLHPLHFPCPRFNNAEIA